MLQSIGEEGVMRETGIETSGEVREGAARMGEEEFQVGESIEGAGEDKT